MEKPLRKPTAMWAIIHKIDFDLGITTTREASFHLQEQCQRVLDLGITTTRVALLVSTPPTEVSAHLTAIDPLFISQSDFEEYIIICRKLP
jgi:hypothetical protein